MIADVVSCHPDVKIVCSSKTSQMLAQFFDLDLDGRLLVVKEGDTLETGHHTFTFVMAPMVHWPEVMVTYDTVDKILFSYIVKRVFEHRLAVRSFFHSSLMRSREILLRR